MADRIFLSNDSVYGYTPAYVYTFSLPDVNESSVHGTSAAMREAIGPMPFNGRIVDFQIGVVLPAVSASGFVSGTVDATLRINSAAVCSTVPAILMAGSAGAAVRKSTNAGGGVSGVVNTASATFSVGDQIAFDWDARSVGSAAAGAAGKGLYVLLTVLPVAA